MAALTASSGTVEPILPLRVEGQDQANLKGEASLQADATVVRAAQTINPTLYPAEWSGPVVVHNHITINIDGTEFREFNKKLDQLLQEMRHSNESAGEAQDQLIAEITAGRTLIRAPKVNRNWIDLLLISPLKYIAEKGGSAAIGKLATSALEWLLKML